MLTWSSSRTMPTLGVRRFSVSDPFAYRLEIVDQRDRAFTDRDATA
jgi:hypothetical protein